MSHDHHKHGSHKEHTHEHEHHHEHAHGHESHPSVGGDSEIAKLRKMVEHWISHNEDHARSYRTWANRAREAGCPEPGEVLDEIALEVTGQKDKFMKILRSIDSSSRSD